jgi:hypothetical protein
MLINEKILKRGGERKGSKKKNAAGILLKEGVMDLEVEAEAEAEAGMVGL